MRSRTRIFAANLRDMLGSFGRWLVTPSYDWISRFCSTVALAAVLVLVVAVFYVEIAR